MRGLVAQALRCLKISVLSAKTCKCVVGLSESGAFEGKLYAFILAKRFGCSGTGGKVAVFGSKRSNCFATEENTLLGMCLRACKRNVCFGAIR